MAQTFVKGGPIGPAISILLAAGAVGAQEVSELPGQDRQLTPNWEEVYRVGSFGGDEWETFGNIGGLAFDAHGNLYVFDRQAGTIIKVDGSGNHAGNVGRPGEGPGELRQPAGFTVMPDGRVVVADIGHRAYSLFRADGTFEKAVSMGGEGMLRLGQFRPLPDGRGVIMGGGNSMSISMQRGAIGGAVMPTTRPIERLDLTGSEVVSSTMVDAWLPPRGDQPQTLAGGGARFTIATPASRAFEPGLHVGVLPDGGVAYADSSAYAINVTGPDGSVRRVVTRPISPRPVTEAMREAERARQLADLEDGGAPQMRVMTRGPGGGQQAVGQGAIREMMRGRIEQMEFYPELPVIRDMRASSGGKLWVERRGEAPTEPGPIDVITPDGQYVGTFAPGETSIPDAFGPDGLAAWIETDEFDVPTVVVRRLPAVLR